MLIPMMGKRRPLGLGEVHAEEGVVDRNERGEAQARHDIFEPGINRAREGQHGKGGGCQRTCDALIQADDDGELDERGQTSTQGVVTHFLIKLHLFLGQLFLIALVLFLHILELF